MGCLLPVIRDWESPAIPSLPTDLAERILWGLSGGNTPHLVLPPRGSPGRKGTIHISVRTTVMVGSLSVNASSEVSLSGRALKRSWHVLYCLEAMRCRRDSYSGVLLVSRAILEPSRYDPYPPSIHSSGTISATSSPLSNILTVELSETATDTASVRLDTEAAATWRLPSPRGNSRWFETASM